jgi:hypothetical protein
MLYDVTIDGKSYRLELERGESRWSCRLDEREIEVDAVLPRPDVLSLRIGNKAYEIKSEHVGSDWHVWVGNARFASEVRDPRSLRSRARALDDQGPKKLVVEAMKMKNEIKSPKKGTIQKMLAAEGVAVNAGDVLAIVE